MKYIGHNLSIKQKINQSIDCKLYSGSLIKENYDYGYVWEGKI